MTAANPDFATFCVSSAPPPQVAAMVALTLESAGGFHNTSLEELRAAVTGGGLEPEPIPVNVAAGPVVREVEINSNPPEGRDPGGNESIAFTDQAVTNQAGGRLPASAVRQIQSLLSAKVRRTPAQREGEFAASGGAAKPAAETKGGRDRPSPSDGSGSQR